jgi:hypothetical protein
MRLLPAALLLACMLPALLATEPARPRLAVVISVDQMRSDYLERFGPHFVEGGFKRFAAQGLTFADAHYRHGVTKTGPGHAVILSGVHADIHGIIANEWRLRTWPLLEEVNCVEDRDSPLVGAAPVTVRSPGGVLEAKTGRSPRHFLATTVGDQLKLRHGPSAKVVGVADKDRAAILMAGRMADGAYWTERGRVVTSTFYRTTLPDYLTAFNAEQRVEKNFGRDWLRLLDAAAYDALQGPDDATGEAEDFGLARTFPKRVDGGHEGIGDDFYDAFDHTPWSNELVADLARAIIVNEHLGSDDGAPDLLAIGFSQTDKIGHAFGPDSHECMDSYLRLDRTLDELFRFIDEKIGLEHCIVVLTADHGAMPLPERVLAANRGVPAGRVKAIDLDKLIQGALDRSFGLPAEGTRWVGRDGLGWHLNPVVLEQKRLAASTVENVARTALLTHPAVASAYTRTDFLSNAPLDAIGEAMRLSYHAPRSADVVAVLRPYFIDRPNSGTTHGAPYDYDTHVPLAWLGVGVPKGRRHERVGVNDLAPTLAHLLGVPRPPQAAGRLLCDPITCDHGVSAVTGRVP